MKKPYLRRFKPVEWVVPKYLRNLPYRGRRSFPPSHAFRLWRHNWLNLNKMRGSWKIYWLRESNNMIKNWFSLRDKLSSIKICHHSPSRRGRYLFSPLKMRLREAWHRKIWEWSIAVCWLSPGRVLTLETTSKTQQCHLLLSLQSQRIAAPIAINEPKASTTCITRIHQRLHRSIPSSCHQRPT